MFSLCFLYALFMFSLSSFIQTGMEELPVRCALDVSPGTSRRRWDGGRGPWCNPADRRPGWSCGPSRAPPAGPLPPAAGIFPTKWNHQIGKEEGERIKVAGSYLLDHIFWIPLILKPYKAPWDSRDCTGFLGILGDSSEGKDQSALPIEWNANRQRRNPDDSRSVFNQEILAIDATSETPVAAVNKVDAVILNMETDHVAT